MQGVHPRLEAGAAGVIHPDKGPSLFFGEIDGLGEFFAVIFSESSGHGGVILGPGDHHPAVDFSESGNHALGGYLPLIHTESRGAVLDEKAKFAEGPLIEKIFDALPGRHLSFFMLPLDRFGSAHLRGFGAPLVKFFIDGCKIFFGQIHGENSSFNGWPFDTPTDPRR